MAAEELLDLVVGAEELRARQVAAEELLDLVAEELLDLVVGAEELRDIKNPDMPRSRARGFVLPGVACVACVAYPCAMPSARIRHPWQATGTDEWTRDDGTWLQTITAMNPGPGFMVETTHAEYGVAVEIPVFGSMRAAKQAAIRQRNRTKYVHLIQE